MKTIGILDKGDPRNIIHHYHVNDNNIYGLNNYHVSRRMLALKEIRHVGNIEVYLINGRKYRMIFQRSL